VRAWLIMTCWLLVACPGQQATWSDGAAPIDGGFAADAAVDAPSDTRPSACAEIAGGHLTRLVPHPGPGYELLVRLSFTDGVPVERDLSACVGALRPDDTSVGTVARRSLAHSLTLVLVDPGRNDTERTQALQATRALLAARAPGERIALFRWGAPTTQIATFSTDDRRLREQLEAGLSAVATSQEPLRDAVERTSAWLDVTGGVAEPTLRTLIFVSPQPRADTTPSALSAVPHLVVWVGGPEGAGLGLPAALRFTPDQAAAVAPLLASYRASAHYAVGICGAEARNLGLRAGDGAPRSLLLPLPLPENQGGSCAEPAIASGGRSFPGRIELTFTEEERARAEEIIQNAYDPATLEDAKQDFTLTVRLGPQHQPVPAEAHYRGASSLLCARRNYTLDLDGKSPRFPFPGASASKFHLLSLCLDRLYLRNHTAMTVMAQEGLFPVPFDLIELVVDGQSQGAYLITEQVTDSLRQSFSGVTSVFRRFLGPDATTAAELKWAAGDDAAAVTAFQDLAAATQGLQGTALESALRSRLDLDQYLRWLALMSALGSGDYIDEVFLYATSTGDQTGAPRQPFSIAGWDQDDLFMPCHHRGSLAFPDPHGLAYCAEADIDHRMLADPRLYGLFVNALEDVLDRLTPARFRAALDGTEAKLNTLLERPGALGAMIELDGIDPQLRDSLTTFRTGLRQDVEDLARRYDENRTRLRGRIADFRAR
jgi:hypothetical protein